MEILASLVIFTGAIFLFLAALGIVRMPDSYNRIQAGTKATTLGITLVFIGVALLHPSWIGKLLVLMLFVLFTNPVSSHALARAAHANGQKVHDGMIVDKLAESKQEE